MEKLTRAGGALAMLDDEEADFHDPTHTKLSDGSVEVDFGGKPEPSGLEGVEFGANLAEHLERDVLMRISDQVVRNYEEDERSREDWKKAYKEGLDYLGLKVEDAVKPFPGACGVYHPMMLEACIRYQANAIMEIFPASGPVRTQIVGDVTKEQMAKAARVEQAMNWWLTVGMSEYRREKEKQLFGEAFCGSAFSKITHDPILDRPSVVYIPALDFVMPYGATSLETSPRYTLIDRKPLNDVFKLQAKGIYRKDVTVTPDGMSISTIGDLGDKLDKVSGISEGLGQDYVTLLEQHVDLDIEEEAEEVQESDEEEQEEGPRVALPYVVTVEKHSGAVLSIYRNWDEKDTFKEKLMHYVLYEYIPGIGAYGFGVSHLIGSSAKAATTILRQLINAGYFANAPGGLKAKGVRMKGENDPHLPGQWKEAEILQGDLAKAFFPLPYKEPSAVLLQLLGIVVEEARRLASIADTDIGEVNGQQPVGTTLAIMERSLKVMTAIQARQHASLGQEFRILARVMRENPPRQRNANSPRALRPEDLDDTIDIIPVSDPNAATGAQRIMLYQAAVQIVAQAPPALQQQMNLMEIYRGLLEALGLKNVDQILPDKPETPLQDPAAENSALVTSKPVRAFATQEHAAHIQSHTAFIQNPDTQKQIGQGPNFPVIMGNFMAHIAEHAGWLQHHEVEKKLGIALPEPGKPISGDIEGPLSMLIAQGQQKVLEDAKMRASQEQAQQQAQDPVLQMQQAELKIKQMEFQLEQQKATAAQQLDQAKLAQAKELEMARIGVQKSGQDAATAQKADAANLNATVQLEIHKIEVAKQMAQIVQSLEELKIAQSQHMQSLMAPPQEAPANG